MVGAEDPAFIRDRRELPCSLTHPHMLERCSRSPCTPCIDPAPVLVAGTVNSLDASTSPVDQEPCQEAASLAFGVVGFGVHLVLTAAPATWWDMLL